MMAAPLPASVMVFGLGYCGRQLALHLGARGVACAGTVRGDAGIHEGLRVLRFPAADEVALRGCLEGVEAVLCTIPPDDQGDPAARFCRQALAAAPDLRWIGYLSSTGVYAGGDGAVVDEHSVADATDASARHRLLAEAQWAALAAERDLPVHLFRLAGLYGPGRNALVQLAQGRARWLDRPDVLFNRVHVDDVCDAVLATMQRPFPPGCHTWLLADDAPASQYEVLACASALSGWPLPPPLADGDPRITPALQRFHAGSKRIDSGHARRELGWSPRYRDYRAGLDAAWAGGDGRPPGASADVAGVSRRQS